MQKFDFHPAVQTWFERRFRKATPPQEAGWPAIRSGAHTLIAAPTGSGKTLAAFLSAIDSLYREGDALPDETRILYVSPLKALGNDVAKNLEQPLAEIKGDDESLPEIRVHVRSGDTPQSVRQKMVRRPPHILVTTPESLYILLTSAGGQNMLRTVRTVIVDEIHAVLGDKRGAHLALSLERLEMLAGHGGEPVQRIGLSATQKPLSDVGSFLVGKGRECTLIDEGHLREADLDVEIPPSPLGAVCSHEVWEEIYERIKELVAEHKTTLIFVGTRKLAERVSAQLARIVGDERVTCHHSSMSKERRLDAEQRLKDGELAALVATASLELGIDIGDIDLVIQVGATRSIATFLQRVGRAGHSVDRTPCGRIFPLTDDELVEAAALMRATASGLLDRTPQPTAPLDILVQQVIAACVRETWVEDELFTSLKRAWPYRDLERADFDAIVELHTEGRHALLHRDGVGGKLRATRRAKMIAVTSGGAIPDNADYRVIQEPGGVVIGSINEDFAIESSAGDIFQLGNASWRVLKLESGVMRVADAQGAPPTLPFWLGEARARTEELSREIAVVRENGVDAAWLEDECSLRPDVAKVLCEYLTAGAEALGCVPTHERVVAERFFDETGGMQLVVHAPFGGRINRAYGLALRKRFCRQFGFELQAAANEEAIVLSLGPQHSFPLEEIFDYLHEKTAREVLIQAMLPTPTFTNRWRWNVSRALFVPRMQAGKRVPPPLVRMRADDLLVKAFPQVVACGETLPPGDLPVPDDHPLVRQTVEDCLHEAMDIDGFLRLVKGLREGTIERVAIDTLEPSPFARGILNAMPYAFLDDAPLEERRTQAVLTRHALDARTADELGQLDPEAIQRVKEEAWPDPRDAEEVHEALTWMGFVVLAEAPDWGTWLAELEAAGRVVREGDRWFAVEATRDPKAVLRGRMEAVGPIESDDPLLLELEQDGVCVRVRIDGRTHWCDRRLLARMHRYTLDRLRKEIEPVSATDCLHFLARWQHVDVESRLEGPAGVLEVARQLSGFEIPAAAWERDILPARVRGYRMEWLDQLMLSGAIAWGRLWGSGAASVRTAPISFFPREELVDWLGLAEAPSRDELSWPARTVIEILEKRGATFPQDLAREAKLLPSHLEAGLSENISRGLCSSDSFVSLRQLLTAPSRRRADAFATGRWSLFRGTPHEETDPAFVARVLLRRWGVVFRKLVERERYPTLWRDVLRELRTLEWKGEIRGGRFVARFSGEQFALPEAVKGLRKARKREADVPLEVAAADPLNLCGILTPDDRVSPAARERVRVV